jgi:UDP-N-acetylglucosamine--N-acetylmuramyl-(pentapeptide) pyrophosphoryl-undecaprenol N-acetylglucosamine transferase
MSTAPLARQVATAGPIVIMAGGTGGHVYPGLAVAAELIARGQSVEWLGSEQSFESALVPSRGLRFHALAVKAVRGKGFLNKLSALWLALRAVFSARKILRALAPKAVISFGGFAAAPGGMAAASLGYPLFVHEQNRIPGLTNKTLARLARGVLTGFPDAFPASKKMQYVGNPVRAEIAALAPPSERFANRVGRSKILVLGGSLGAQAINQLMPQALALIATDDRPDVWHQAGAKHIDAAQLAYADAKVQAKVVPFIDQVVDAYAWADVVICRAGASTVAELAAAGLGALFIPFPFAVDDHQTANAQWLVEQNAALCIQQNALSAESLRDVLARFSDREFCLRLANAARAAAKTDAARLCADILCQQSDRSERAS